MLNGSRERKKSVELLKIISHLILKYDHFAMVTFFFSLSLMFGIYCVRKFSVLTFHEHTYTNYNIHSLLSCQRAYRQTSCVPFVHFSLKFMICNKFLIGAPTKPRHTENKLRLTAEWKAQSGKRWTNLYRFMQIKISHAKVTVFVVDIDCFIFSDFTVTKLWKKATMKQSWRGVKCNGKLSKWATLLLSSEPLHFKRCTHTACGLAAKADLINECICTIFTKSHKI